MNTVFILILILGLIFLYYYRKKINIERMVASLLILALFFIFYSIYMNLNNKPFLNHVLIGVLLMIFATYLLVEKGFFSDEES